MRGAKEVSVRLSGPGENREKTVRADVEHDFSDVIGSGRMEILGERSGFGQKPNGGGTLPGQLTAETAGATFQRRRGVSSAYPVDGLAHHIHSP